MGAGVVLSKKCRNFRRGRPHPRYKPSKKPRYPLLGFVRCILWPPIERITLILNLRST
jgi:hypothetical protein